MKARFERKICLKKKREQKVKRFGNTVIGRNLKSQRITSVSPHP